MAMKYFHKILLFSLFIGRYERKNKCHDDVGDPIWIDSCQTNVRITVEVIYTLHQRKYRTNYGNMF